MIYSCGNRWLEQIGLDEDTELISSGLDWVLIVIWEQEVVD